MATVAKKNESWSCYFSTHPMEVPVHKILSCLLICVAELVNHNRPVKMRMQQKLLHCVMMMMMQTCLFVGGVIGFLRGVSNTLAPVSSCFPWRPSSTCPFAVLERNLLLETLSRTVYNCKLLSCLEQTHWEPFVRIYTTLVGIVFGVFTLQ